MSSGIPREAADWLAENGFGRVIGSRAVSGGCIHNGRRLQCDTGRTAFLKTNAHVPPDVFSTEAAGLAALAAPGCIRIPQVYAVGERFLLLEDLAPGTPAGDYWPRLGRELAALHGVTRPEFGFEQDNYLGSTPQPNPPTADGYAFFAEHRLLYQAEMAARRGLLPHGDLQHVARLANRLHSLVPEQPASLIHGDLWSGNLITDAGGRPALIDPAAHYGWREAELAMMVLFGSPPEAFFAAYDEAAPLAPGYQTRFRIYNLYHLLNHVNLFGTGYLGQVQSILRTI